MVKVFAPIKVNSLVIDFLIESMAVSIPTKAVMPTAIIKTVRIVLNRFDLMELRDIFRFSLKKVTKRISDIAIIIMYSLDNISTNVKISLQNRKP